MTKWLLRVFLFLMPIILAAVVVLIIPVNRKYAYSFIAKGGCQARPPWIYKQLFTDTQNIDVAFIGTSHTMGAVNDSLIEQLVFDNTGKLVKCKNLSFCGFGRNFDYLIAQDLIANKMPKIIVLEVRENESRAGHLSFPYLATTYNLFSAPKAFNQSYIPDIYKAFLFRLQYIREQATNEDEKRTMDISDSQYGYNGHDLLIANPDELDADFKKMLEKNKHHNKYLDSLAEISPLNYVQQIKDLAAQHGIRLVLLYLPAYTHQITDSEIVDKYSKYGPIIMTDSTTLKNKNNWFDREHLNIAGAELISQKVARYLSTTKYQ